MPAASRVLLDTAGGGLIQGPGQTFVRIGGYSWAVVGDLVTPHGLPPHDAAVLTQGSPLVRIAGAPAVRAGDPASCGDPATGTAWVTSA
ncbi:MAG: PAAR domain-containing protein [Planctomycetota bacterium]